MFQEAGEEKVKRKIQPYEEAPMYLNGKANKQTEEIVKILEPVKEIMEEMKLDIPDGYEFFGIDDDNKIVLTKKQPQYPKTYEECCKVLDIQSDWHLTFELNNPASCDLCVKNEFEYVYKLEAFRKLLVCRDAYWKIAGDWKPDWNDCENIKYIIGGYDGEIGYDQNYHIHKILAFPTAEMRDAFYENFKELIERCKELL